MASRGRDCRIDPEKLKAAVRRLDEQLEHARESSRQLQERDAKYDELRGVLDRLPEKVTHPIMVPYGPLAFFEGHLEHTNEVLVQLSSEYFALKTAKQAGGTVNRRKTRLREDMKDVDKEVQELEQRKRLAVGEASAGGIRLGPENDPEDGILDIREPCEEDSGRAQSCGVAGATCTRDADGYLDIREPEDAAPADFAAGFDSAAFRSSPSAAPSSNGPDLARLRELERLESKDEMDELDGLLDSYERTGLPPSGTAPDVCAAGQLLADAGSPAASGGAAAAAQIRSPADIYALMSSADAAGATASSAPSPSLAPPAAAVVEKPLRKPVEQAFVPPVRQVPDTAWAGQIQERNVAPAAAASDSTAAAAAPKRVSKFKMDRSKAGN